MNMSVCLLDISVLWLNMYIYIYWDEFSSYEYQVSIKQLAINLIKQLRRYDNAAWLVILSPVRHRERGRLISIVENALQRSRELFQVD